MSLETFENLPDEKKKRVLEAALDEFAEHGYHQASLNRMVKRLSIAKGSLFNYFESKQGLFEYVFERAVDTIKGPLKEARSGPGGLKEKLRRTLLAGAEFVHRHPRLYRVYLKVLFQENVPFRQAFLKRVRGYSSRYLRPLVIQAQENDELDTQLDPDTVVFVLDSVMDRFLQALAVPYVDERLHGMDQKNIETEIDRLLQVLDARLTGSGGTDA